MQRGAAILAVTLVLAGGGPASSQSRGVYLELVDEYRDGSADATARMSQISERR